MQGLKILKHSVLVFPKIAKPHAPVICIPHTHLWEWAGNSRAYVQACRALTFLEVYKVLLLFYNFPNHLFSGWQI